MFYKLQTDEEVECIPGQPITNPEKLVNAPIMLGAVQETRSFRVGEAVTLTIGDFGEIVMNCNLCGDDLVAKLPVLSPPVPPI